MASHMLSSRRANAYSSFHPCRFRARATIRRCSALGDSTGFMCQRHDAPKRENASRYSRFASWLRQISAISSGWFPLSVCTGSISLPHARRAVFQSLRRSRLNTSQHRAFAGLCRIDVSARFPCMLEQTRIGRELYTFHPPTYDSAGFWCGFCLVMVRSIPVPSFLDTGSRLVGSGSMLPRVFGFLAGAGVWSNRSLRHWQDRSRRFGS